MLELDSNPDTFSLDIRPAYIDAGRAAMAQMLGADVNNLGFTENATFGKHLLFS